MRSLIQALNHVAQSCRFWTRNAHLGIRVPWPLVEKKRSNLRSGRLIQHCVTHCTFPKPCVQSFRGSAIEYVRHSNLLPRAVCAARSSGQQVVAAPRRWRCRCSWLARARGAAVPCGLCVCLFLPPRWIPVLIGTRCHGVPIARSFAR